MIQDFVGVIGKGNHRFASIKDKFLEAALTKEVNNGWMTPFKTANVIKIPGLELAPLGVVSHFGILSLREFIKIL